MLDIDDEPPHRLVHLLQSDGADGRGVGESRPGGRSRSSSLIDKGTQTRSVACEEISSGATCGSAEGPSSALYYFCIGPLSIDCQNCKPNLCRDVGIRPVRRIGQRTGLAQSLAQQ